MGCKICKPKELGCLTCHKNINPKEPFCFEKEACSIPYAMVRDGKIIGYEKESKTEIEETQEQKETLLDNIQEICEAAKVLVDHVEKYVRQECHRGTLLSMKDKLKELLEFKKEVPWWREQYYINIPWPESQKLLSLTEAIEDGVIIFGPSNSCFVTISFFDNVLKDEFQEGTKGSVE